MEYFEIRITNAAPEVKELLVWYLGEEGFESFSDDGNDLLAYIPQQNYHPEKVKEITDKFNLSFTDQLIPDQNWNEEWEKNFEPVLIADRCFVRAPFHEPLKKAEFDIVIMPKMSFGTAHHETTSGIISMMLDLDFRDKKVLDMGCGTAVLAILAEKLGASEILAIDNDNWAYQNSLENIQRNNCTHISVKEGGAEQISGKFDVILANINRNILLGQMKNYSDSALPGALLLMSGFYEEDLPSITEKAESEGFTFMNSVSKNRWVAAIYKK